MSSRAAMSFWVPLPEPLFNKALAYCVPEALKVFAVKEIPFLQGVSRETGPEDPVLGVDIGPILDKPIFVTDSFYVFKNAFHKKVGVKPSPRLHPRNGY